MPKINVYLPDDLADAVRDTGVPVSAICQRALEQAVKRIRTVREAAAGDLTGAALRDRLPQLTPRAVTALHLAVAEATDSGATTVSTGHLLRAILAEGGNLALQILTAMEIDRTPLAAVAVTGEPGGGAGLRLTAPAATAIELAVAEAAGYGHNYLGCEHLLLGLAAEPDGAAARVLREAGADAKSLRRAAAAALAGYAHLRASTAPGPDATGALLTAVRQEIRPLIDRIERLEARTQPQ